MGFFVIAVILAIIGVIVALCVDSQASAPVFVLAFLLILFGLFANWGGYEEAFVSKEYELIPLIEDTNIYLIQSDGGTKMCKYKIVSEHDSNVENAVIKKISASVELEHIKEGQKPILREYVSKPKKSKWNGIFVSDKEYAVLFVPESYIIK